MLKQMSDEEVLSLFKKKKCWGLACSVDLNDCNPQKIRDAKIIMDFVIALCDLIKMKRFGNPVVVYFGEDQKVQGYSMTQLIESSLISGHFANQTNAAYLDIFSCKEYAPNRAAKFCKDFFEAKKHTLNIVFRE